MAAHSGRCVARELVGQMEKHLGAKLDWVAVDRWNTQYPHVNTILRGVADDGQGALKLGR